MKRDLIEQPKNGVLVKQGSRYFKPEIKTKKYSPEEIWIKWLKRSLNYSKVFQ